MAPPIWTTSRGKHGVAREDAVHAMLHATFTMVLLDEEQPSAGQIRLFVGPRHAQALAGDEIEVLVHEFPETGDQAVIFHVMPLGAKYRRYREEQQG